MEELTQEKISLEEIPTAQGEIVETDDGLDVDDLMPKMVFNQSEVTDAEKKPELISDNELTGIYDEILVMLRKEHEQVTDYIDNFAEMVINGGDSIYSQQRSICKFGQNQN